MISKYLIRVLAKCLYLYVPKMAFQLFWPELVSAGARLQSTRIDMDLPHENLLSLPSCPECCMRGDLLIFFTTNFLQMQVCSLQHNVQIL